jgi:4-hydroxybenzoate polyprenyltransferase
LPFGLVFTLIVIIAVFDSIFYSLPPLRFKRHPVTALIAFSGAVGLSFLAGLAATNRLSQIDPWFILFTVFMMTYGTVKNVPDFLGDHLNGLKTTVTAFKDLKRAVRISTILLLLPYFLLILLIGTGILSKVYLLNIPLMAFPVYWAYRNFRAVNREDQERLHTQGFIYAVSFYLFNLILSQPSPVSLAITFSVLLAIFLLTKLRVDSRIG